MTDVNGQLLNNLILFGRLLRDLGMDVNPGRMIDVVHALQYVEIGRRDDFYHTLRTLLVNRRDDLAVFDQAFNLFWRRPTDGSIELNLGDLLQKRDQPPTLVMPPPLEEESAAPASPKQQEGDEETQEIIEVTRTFSTREVLRQKDFGDLSGEELAAIRRMMARLIWRLGERRTRRQQPGRGWRLDLRRSLRRNFRYGGEQLQWLRLTPRIKPRPLVIIADISGSMERYTRLLLHFLYSLAEGLDQRVEVFVFSTRLTRITRQLRSRDVDRALQEVAQTVPDWSGGTRIGDALKAFNFAWGRRVLRGGALVLLISDGWDRGDPELLRREMARLQRTSHRLVWLNPLLGSPRYEPLTRGIRAALPYIDDFLPVHNLVSLEDLALHLAQLDEKRSSRRQPIKTSGAAFVHGKNRVFPKNPVFEEFSKKPGF
ncbi:MAG: VWA domain-containing protein [Anaerolineales bacterium]|nr:VWA domain-containing protein [Anaerolineales bacterium]MCB8951367.1 VWA domain-containing protein [Ardenticatenales bacterium]